MIPTSAEFLPIPLGIVGLLSCVDIVCAWPVLLFSGFSPPSIGFIKGRMFYPSSFVPFHLSLYGSVSCYAVRAVLSICSLFSWLLLAIAG